jgi:hypothetical protein
LFALNLECFAAAAKGEKKTSFKALSHLALN